MPWVGFETTVLAFERAKTVHALDHAAIVTGSFTIIFNNNLWALQSVMDLGIFFYSFLII
jgi:hypothetical protein